jgi:hypothetical protein
VEDLDDGGGDRRGIEVPAEEERAHGVDLAAVGDAVNEASAWT